MNHDDTTTTPTDADKRYLISRCPSFLYTSRDQRGATIWAFQLATCRTLDEAYAYAIDEGGTP